MAGYDPVVATFEANTAGAVEAIARYEDVLTELQATFDRVAEASTVFDERLGVAERGFQSAAAEANILSSQITELGDFLDTAGSGAKSLASGLSSISKSADTVAAALDADGTAVAEFATRVDSVDEQLATFSGRMALMGDSAVALGGKFADAGTEILRSLAGINEEIAATVAAMNEAAVSTAAFATSQLKAAEATKTVQSASKASTTSMKEVNSALLMVGGAFDLIDFGALKMAGTFQANMNRLQTEAGLSSDRIVAFAGSMQGLEDKVIDVGNQTGFTGTEISNALYEPISAGLSLSNALQTVKVSAEEAQISGASLEDTTTGLTAILKDFGTSIASPEQGMADLNAIVGQGMMRFQDFDQAIKNWAPTAATFGVSLNSAGAALAYMTDRGESAQSAGTKLAQIMAMMVGQTTQAGQLMGALGLSTDAVTTSNDAMAGAMEKAHITTGQLATDLRKPDGLAVALNDLKAHLEDAGLSADEANSVLVRAFGGGRQFKGLAELLENTDQLQQKFDQISHDSNIDHFQAQWDTVSQSFSVEWDKMTAAVKNFSLSVGSNLMAIGSSIVSVFGNVFRTLSENKDVTVALSGAMGVLAVALPIGALVTFVANMSAMAKTVSLVSLNMAALGAGFAYGISNINSLSGQVSLAITSMVALADVAKVLGGTDGLISKIGGALSNAGAAFSGWRSDIGAAASGIEKFKVGAAGVGEFLAGPWGIALGAAVVGLTAFMTGSSSASKAVSDLTDAIRQDSGELGKNSQAWVVHQLQTTGAYDQANRLGISTNLVTDAVMGNVTALHDVNSALSTHTTTVTSVNTAHGQLKTNTQELTGDTVNLKNTIDSTKATIEASKAAYDQQSAAATAASKSSDALSTAEDDASVSALRASANSDGLTQSASNVSQALNDAKSKAQQLKDALDVLSGGNIDAEKAELDLRDTMDNVTKTFQKNGVTLDENTQQGRDNYKAILDGVSAAQQHAEAVSEQTKNVQKGNEAFQQDVVQLQDVWAKAGLTKDQIQDLTNKYLQVPHNLDTTVTAHTDDANAKIVQIRTGLDGLTSKSITVSVNYQSANQRVMSAVGGHIGKFAGGGVAGFDFGGEVFGPGTESSDSIPAMLSDNEYVVRASAAQRIGTTALNLLNEGDLDSLYRMLGQRPDVHGGDSSIDMGTLAGALGGQQGQPVVVVNITTQGSILAENDLRAIVQQTVLRYANRNVGPGWTGAFT